MDIGICALCQWCSDQLYKEQHVKPCRKVHIRNMFWTMTKMQVHIYHYQQVSINGLKGDMQIQFTHDAY